MLSARTCSPVVLCNPSTYSGKLCPSCLFIFAFSYTCMQCSVHRALETGKSFLEIKMQMRRKVFFVLFCIVFCALVHLRVCGEALCSVAICPDDPRALW